MIQVGTDLHRFKLLFALINLSLVVIVYERKLSWPFNADAETFER